MNKTEQRYALVLEARKRNGEILGWVFEGLTFKLAERTHFTPDFVVYAKDGTVELHEVKAATRKGKVLIEDDANVKIKVAADTFPFQFILTYEHGGTWVFKAY